MDRAQLVRTIDSLNRSISHCERHKKKLLAYIQKLKDKCVNREITYSEYEDFLKEKLDGKTLHEWLDYYDSCIKTYEKRIKSLKKTSKIKKTLIMFFSIALISLLVFSAFYFRPILVGLIVGEPVKTYTQPVKLVFEE